MRRSHPFHVTPRLSDYGFGDDAEPRRCIEPRVMHAAVPGHFPTAKSPKGLLRTSSPLMMDALVHLDTDPLAVRLAEFPMRIHWWARDAFGVLYKRADVPDLGVVWRDGSLSFHHCVPLAIQAEKPLFDADARELGRVLAEEHGAHYSVLDERDLHVRPLFPNLRTMWRHNLGDLDPAAVDAVRVALERRRRAGELSTIGSLKADCGLPAFWVVFEGDAPPRPLEGNDRVFSAVMTLAMAGEISLELGKPFRDATPILPGVLLPVGRAA